ncbi:cytosolic endo-beta-N-acetylglucosaminidase 1-like [Cannabis sativa]|uniref:cytosolic endo-beta-N-acetylglucosaminidase 1-like n=1 Tax=Cannabis sativa TaxID=3483 RepID=UPI0029CA6487|nr:cytosolic endo-beta-N-acetylglucosaminidase 1-like [Cannabis sativa]
MFLQKLLTLIHQTLKKLFLFIIRKMSTPTSIPELKSPNPDPELKTPPSSDPQPKSLASEPPSFDPTRPSVPVSYPIKTLEELESRSYFDSFHYPFNKASVPFPRGATSSPPDRPQLLVCHDMAGGYGDDKWVQGGTNGEAYSIWHWHLIDVFVYFSHNLVALPPVSWVNTAHQHGVKVLATFIVEWDAGIAIADKLLETEESSQMYAERLTELAVALGFDGWLLNMEVKLNVNQIPNLKTFISHLTQTMHSKIPGSLVIWYDSVTVDGSVLYQNQLTEKNKPFFDICDGIFLNYWWREHYPSRSAAVAGNRKYDVYFGIDVFGRNTFGGGHWNTSFALDVLKKGDVSAAVFAPGWVYETNQPPDFQTAQNHWWSLVEKSWGIAQRYPRVLPFYSNFDQGRGHHFSVDGLQVLDSSWNNLSSQGFQPLLEYKDSSTTDGIKVLVDLKEGSYRGGSNITFKGSLKGSGDFTARLFLGELPLGNSPLYFTYSVKSKANSLLGLNLNFSSGAGEKKSVLLAPAKVDHLSGKFSTVVTTRQLENLGASSEWTIQESSISLSGHTLTEISAYCYRSDHRIVKLDDDNTSDQSTASAEYYAVLGHITVKSSEQKSNFPPSSSWVVEGEHIKWTPSSEDSKTVSVKIIWKLKDGNDSTFPKYNIYAKKAESASEFLGVARVQAFYVGDYAVPSGSSGVKFFIQVCDVDGSSQTLDDSPSLLLEPTT